MFNKDNRKGLLARVPWHQDHDIANTVNILFEELYDSAQHVNKDIEELDIYLGAVLRGYEGRKFTDY